MARPISRGLFGHEVTPVLKVSTCLWHGKDVEEAVRFYVSLLPGSEIEHVLRSPGPWPGGQAGDVILVSFALNGQSYQALNGGAPAEYGTAASIAVACPDQAEVDRLWAALAANGGPESPGGGPPPPRGGARNRRGGGSRPGGRARGTLPLAPPPPPAPPGPRGGGAASS